MNSTELTEAVGNLPDEIIDSLIETMRGMLAEQESRSNEDLTKIERYIDRTGINAESCRRYDLCAGEIGAMYELAQTDVPAALMLAFKYGRAKGCRMMKNIAYKEWYSVRNRVPFFKNFLLKREIFTG